MEEEWEEEWAGSTVGSTTVVGREGWWVGFGVEKDSIAIEGLRSGVVVLMM